MVKKKKLNEDVHPLKQVDGYIVALAKETNKFCIVEKKSTYKFILEPIYEYADIYKHEHEIIFVATKLNEETDTETYFTFDTKGNEIKPEIEAFKDIIFLQFFPCGMASVIYRNDKNETMVNYINTNGELLFDIDLIKDYYEISNPAIDANTKEIYVNCYKDPIDENTDNFDRYVYVNDEEKFIKV